MIKLFQAAAIAVCTISAGAVAASPLPAVDGDYEGSYDLGNAFSSHGLWLPNLFRGATPHWSVLSGSAEYDNGELTLTGRVEHATVAGYELDFSFKLFETAHAGPPECGAAACQSISQEQSDNIVYFNTGLNALQGTVTGVVGTVLEGLSLDITMNDVGGDKPGQLGYGGNWVNLEFGYSNWLFWDVTAQADNTNYVTKQNSGKGDVNLDLLANDGGTLTTVPVPAGLPLLLTAFAGFAIARRRARA